MLQIHSDASYLSASKARHRVAVFFFFNNNPAQPEQAKLNGVIHVLWKIIKSVLGSAAKSEISSAFLNAHETIPIRNTLEELNHKQPANPI